MPILDALAECRVLAIDDEEANLDLLQFFLADEGFPNFTGTSDPRGALATFDEVRPDLVLLDLHMPHIDGFGMMRGLRERVGPDDFVPILVLTADVTDGARLRALEEGASDFLTKPLDGVEVVLRIRNLLRTRVLHRAQQEGRARAEAAGRRAAFLAEASRVLGASLDAETTLAMLPRLAVPRLADYCVVDLVGRGEPRHRAGAAHTDAEAEELLVDGAPLWAGAFPDAHPMVRSLTEGQFVLLEPVDPVALEEGATAEELRALHRLRPTSLITVPLVLSGRLAGTLSLVMSHSGRRFEADDLGLAEELVRRAGAAQENARLFHDAQQATRARDQMLGVVAHDLRNPLSTIRLAAELLLELVPDATHRKHLATLHRSALRMNELIQDLMEVSRIESGALTLATRPERVSALLAEAGSMLGPLAQAHGLALETAVDDGVETVLGDSRRLLQVISNLVGNAIKFTPEGGRIGLRATAAGGEVRFAVADTGPGIPPEQLPHVFGRFWQANRGDRRGIGLGLSIARGIVEAHGGRIWVESDLGEGSTFYFTVPVTAAPASASLPPAFTVAGSSESVVGADD
jgi:signal transduction histidine kinase/DNA-binding NarL/FixJ family response regulator